MLRNTTFNRRRFLALGAASLAALQAGAKARVPVGVLLFAAQKELIADFNGTLKAVAQMGFEGVEFTQYIDWTVARAKEIRAVLDDVHLQCYSTHNEPQVFTNRLEHAMEVNSILGSKTVSCVRGLTAKPGGSGFPGSGIDGWKQLTELLQHSAEKLKASSQRCGFHNHTVEFEDIDGQRPIDILASAPDLFFQTDIWMCSRSADPVAFLEKYPKRSDCILVTDGSPSTGKPTLLGDGGMPWSKIFAAAEDKAGIRFYLIAQEGGTDLPGLQAIRKDLERFRKLHG
jgi:sugar phosphate isomerase/epimerase